MPTVQEIAREFSLWFDWGERDDGSKFVSLKDGHPKELETLVRKAHGDMMPDDQRYEFIEDAIDALADNEDEEYARYEAEEADIYTSDLLKWVSSLLSRGDYVDEAIEEYGYPEEGFVRALQYGQSFEKREVFDLVLRELERIAGEREEVEDEEVE